MDWRLARIVEGGEVRIIGRVAGFDVHRGGDEISRATIKAWIIYCGMSRVSSVLALAFFFFFFLVLFSLEGGGVSGNIDTRRDTLWGSECSGIGFGNWFLVKWKMENSFWRMGYLMGKELLLSRYNYHIYFVQFYKKKNYIVIKLTNKYIVLFSVRLLHKLYDVVVVCSPNGKCVSYSAASTRKRSRKFRPCSYNDVDTHSHACFDVCFFIPSHRRSTQIVGIFIRESNTTLT